MNRKKLKEIAERSRRALNAAQGFDTEKTTLKAAGTLTEARAAELDASYARAWAEYQDGQTELRRAQQLDAADRELEALDTEPVPVHPRDGERQGDDEDDGDGEGVVGRTARRVSRWQEEADFDGTSLVEGRGGRQGLADHRNAYILRRMTSRTPMPKQARAAMERYIHMRRGGRLTDVEERALDPYKDLDGGWALSHEMSREVIRQIRNEVYIMQRARVIPTSSASISFPVFKFRGHGQDKHRALKDYATKDIRDILGKKTFSPNEFGDIVKVPEQLFADADYPIFEHLSQEIAADGGEQKENSFLNGTGKNEPLGVLQTPIPNYPTAGVALVADDVKGFPYKLVKSRRKNAAWMMNRTALEMISKFRNDSGSGPGTGNYLFQQGLKDTDPDTLIGYPIMESEFFPDGIASGAASGTAIALFGDWFMGYWIVMRLALVIRRLDELYAEQGLIGFRYTERYDAAPVRLDCFAVLTKK